MAKVIVIAEEKFTEKDRETYMKWKQEVKVGDIKRFHFLVEIEENVFANCYINSDKITKNTEIYTEKIVDSNKEVINWSQLHQKKLTSNKIADITHETICNYLVKREEKLTFIPEYVFLYVKNEIAMVKSLTDKCKEANFEEFEIKIGNENICIQPHLAWDENNKPVKDIKGVEYWMIHHQDLYGSESIWSTADTLVNAEELFKQAEKSRNDCVNFYINKLLPIGFIPCEKLTEKQKELYSDSCFSDWHKDCFGHRPRGNDNECLRLFIARGSLEKEYVEYVKSFNLNGKECPISFNDFKMEKMDRNCEEDFDDISLD